MRFPFRSIHYNGEWEWRFCRAAFKDMKRNWPIKDKYYDGEDLMNMSWMTGTSAQFQAWVFLFLHPEFGFQFFHFFVVWSLGFKLLVF